MYHRYPKAMPRRMSKRNRTIVGFAILILLVLTVALLVGYVGATTANSRTRLSLIEKVQNEVSQARNRATQLSQTSGSATASMVALVRQHIYGARLLNELTSNIYGTGNLLVSDASINLCINYLDQLDHNLQTGTNLTSTFTLLRDAIEELYLEADELQ